MSIDTDEDLTALREVARITRQTLDALERHVRAGVTTADLDRIAQDVFRKNGARSAPALVYGFPKTVLISLNDEIVHGIPGERRIERGDLVKLDVTVEKDGYYADAARTVVAGSGSDVAKRLIACARSAFRAAASVAKAGTPVNEVGRAVETEVRRCGFHVIRGLTGHGVGRSIHEEPSVPNHYVSGQEDVLTEGLVITIEPMISVSPSRPIDGGDGWTIRTHDGGLSAHYEHTLVITQGEPQVLTA